MIRVELAVGLNGVGVGGGMWRHRLGFSGVSALRNQNTHGGAWLAVLLSACAACLLAVLLPRCASSWSLCS